MCLGGGRLFSRPQRVQMLTWCAVCAAPCVLLLLLLLLLLLMVQTSLLFMELLFATFMSGGYHPVFTEKWHDRNAAQDVVWVYQTWWLESELEAHRGIWTRNYPEPAMTSAIAPDPLALLREHEAGRDPYTAPGGSITHREARQAAERKAEGGDAAPGQAGGVLQLNRAG